MKKILLALAIGASLTGNVTAAIKYWDIDGATPGPGGGGVPTGTWNNVLTNWTTDPSGSSAPTTWADFDDAVFSAGTDAAGLIYVVTTPAAPGINVKSITVEEGTVTNGTGVVNFGANNGQFTIADTAIWTTSGAGTGLMNGSAGITMGLPATTGTGILKLGGTSGGLNNPSGPILTINSGVVEFTGDGGLGAAPTTLKPNAVQINDGAILRFYRDTNAVGDVPVNRGFTINGTATIETKFEGAATNTGSLLLIHNAISGPGATLVKAGLGELRVDSSQSTVNTFEKLSIQGGSYRIGQANSLGVDTQLGAIPGAFMQDQITIDNGAALGFLGIVANNTVVLNQNRGITIGGGGGSLDAFTASGTIPGKITGGILTKIGNFEVNLSNGTNDYTSTTINAGAINANNTTGSATGTGLVLVNANGTLGGTGFVTGPIDVQANGRIKAGIGTTGQDLDVSTVTIQAGGAIEAVVGSTFADVLNVTTPGGMTLNGGLITVSSSSAVGSPAGKIYKIIDYNTNFVGSIAGMLNNATGYDGTTINNIPGNTSIEVTVGSTLQDRTWSLDGDSNWSIADTGNWTSPGQPNGPSTTARFSTAATGLRIATISDTSKYVGNLIFSPGAGGSYKIASGSTSYQLIFSTYTGNATMDVQGGTHEISARVLFSSPTTINAASGASVTLTAAGNGTSAFPAVINDGGVTKTGQGTFLISQDWGGIAPVTINDGSIKFAISAAGFANFCDLTINAPGLLDLNGIGDAFGSLSGNGNVNNAGNLTMNGSNVLTTATYSGNITGSIATHTFTKSGSFTQILSGTNVFVNVTATSAAVSVTAGTLLLNNTAALTTGTGVHSVFANATLGGIGRVGGRINVSNNGNVAPGSGGIGTLTLDGTTPTTPMLSMLGTGSKLTFDLNTGLQSDTIALINGAANDIGFNSTVINFNDLSGGSLASGDYTLFTSNVAGAYGGLTLSGDTITAGLTVAPAFLTAYPTAVLKLSGNNILLNLAAAALLGDFNSNGTVDAADYAIWRNNEIANAPLPNDSGLLTQAARYDLWKANFGKTSPGSGSGSLVSAVPEPGSLLLMLAGLLAVSGYRKR